jgi:hypothetical protein
MSASKPVSVVVAAVVVWVLGAAWYTLLAETWMAALGKTRDQLMQQSAGTVATSYVVGFLAILVMCSVLGWLLARLDVATFAAGARIGAIAGLLPAGCLALNYAFEVRPVSLWLINAAYVVVGLAIAGAIVGGWPRRAAATAAA